MSTMNYEDTKDAITALEIVRVALTDIDIREIVLDAMDLSDEEARRILMKVQESLLEVGHEPQG